MEKYGFVYIWYDKKHKRFYVGCHWGTIDDDYICSSTWMNNSYKRRPQDFKRRILKSNLTREFLLEEEHKWLQLIKEEELGKKYYNLHRHHFGHWSIDQRTHLTVRQKLSEASKKLHQDPIYKQKFLEGRKNLPARTEEAIRKTAIANTGKKRSNETKKKIGDAHRGKIRGPLSDSHKAALSKALSGSKNPFWGKQHDPIRKKEISAKISAKMKGRPPNNAQWMKNSFWWNNGSINKRSHDKPGSDWILGKIK